MCCYHLVFQALPKPKLNAKQQAELDARLAYKPEAQEAAVDIQKHVRGLLASDRVEIVRANHQQAMTGCGDGYGNGDGSSGGAGGGNNSSSGTSRSRRPPAHTFHPPAKRFHGSNLPRLSQEGRGDGGRGEQQLGVEAEERRLSEVSERALQLAGYQSKKPASPSDEPRVPRYHMEEGRMLLEELALLNAKVRSLCHCFRRGFVFFHQARECFHVIADVSGTHSFSLLQKYYRNSSHCIFTKLARSNILFVAQ